MSSTQTSLHQSSGPFHLFSSFRTPVVLSDVWNKLFSVNTPLKTPNKVSNCVCVLEYDPALELSLAHEENAKLKDVVSKQEQAISAIRFVQEWGGTVFMFCNIVIFLQQVGGLQIFVLVSMAAKSIYGRVRNFFL
jgi:hypothetical protein